MIRMIPQLRQSMRAMRPARMFSQLKKVNNYVLPDLPAIRVNPKVLRPAQKGDKPMTVTQLYDSIGVYKKYRFVPQCRYFAVEYKNRIYHVFNAYHYPMGRMIHKIAHCIRGKNTPHFKNNEVNIRNGDVCIVVNAEDPLFTGRKLMHKNFKYHTGFVGRLKTFSYRTVLNKKPELLYHYLLKKSMPKNKISEKYLQNLKLFRGPVHNLKDIPQFSPNRVVNDPITEVDLVAEWEKCQNDPSMKTLYTRRDGYLLDANAPVFDEKQPNLDTTGQKFDADSKTRKVPLHSTHAIMKAVKQQQRMMRRYNTLRAPYRKKQDFDKGFQYFFRQKDIDRSPYKDILEQEDEVDEEDDITEDPLHRKGWDL